MEHYIENVIKIKLKEVNAVKKIFGFLFMLAFVMTMGSTISVQAATPQGDLPEGWRHIEYNTLPQETQM